MLTLGRRGPSLMLKRSFDRNVPLLEELCRRDDPTTAAFRGGPHNLPCKQGR